MSREQYEREAREKAQKVINEFSSLVNNFSFNPKDFIEAFSREHRTLQQSMFSAMLSLMIAMTKDDYYTDGRNQYSKETAILLVKGYAEAKKQEYLDQNGATDEYYQRRAEEIKQDILRQPEIYFNLPLI